MATDSTKTAPAPKAAAKPADEPKPAAAAVAETEAATEEAAEAVPETLELAKPKNKEELYENIKRMLNHKAAKTFAPVANRAKKAKGLDLKMRQVYGDNDARELVTYVFDSFMDILEALATSKNDGTYQPANLGIPGGYGSFQLTTAAATTKMTPQGTKIEVAKRWRLKWSVGKAVNDRLQKFGPPPADEAAPAASEG